MEVTEKEGLGEVQFTANIVQLQVELNSGLPCVIKTDTIRPKLLHGHHTVIFDS